MSLVHVAHLLISLGLGEVRSFQDIRDATSARLEITFLDAHAAAYVLNLTIMEAGIIFSCFPPQESSLVERICHCWVCLVSICSFTLVCDCEVYARYP